MTGHSEPQAPAAALAGKRLGRRIKHWGGPLRGSPHHRPAGCAGAAVPRVPRDGHGVGDAEATAGVTVTPSDRDPSESDYRAAPLRTAAQRARSWHQARLGDSRAWAMTLSRIRV